MSEKQNVPVYYFLGLLESGKTSVIIDFLANNQFGKAECNLIIMGEEGEEEIDEEAPAVDGVEETEAAPAKDFISRLNPNSLTIVRGLAEPIIRDCEVGATFQFLRNGYFCKDPDSTPDLPVYNRTVGLRDSFAKGK